MWNVRWRERGKFHFTSNIVRYFTISVRKLFHRERKRTISLKLVKVQIRSQKTQNIFFTWVKVVSTWPFLYLISYCFCFVCSRIGISEVGFTHIAEYQKWAKPSFVKTQRVCQIFGCIRISINKKISDRCIISIRFICFRWLLSWSLSLYLGFHIWKSPLLLLVLYWV